MVFSQWDWQITTLSVLIMVIDFLTNDKLAEAFSAISLSHVTKKDATPRTKHARSNSNSLMRKSEINLDVL